MSFAVTWYRDSRDKDLFNVNWEPFSEEDIHGIIDVFYDSLGYDVKNMHKSDRSNEHAADLIISKEGSASKAIAVKIKPKKRDAYQARELSERKEKEKIYYYVETPTNDFISKTKRIKNVSFKPMKEFVQECFNKNPILYFDLITSNKFKINEYINSSKLYLTAALMLKGRKFKKTRELSKASRQELWRIKDIAVELNKSSEKLMYFYEQKTILGQSRIEETKIFLSILRDLEATLENLPILIESFYKHNKDFLAYDAAETYGDSDWLYFRNPAIGLQPVEIEKYIKSYKRSKANLEEISMLGGFSISKNIYNKKLSEIFYSIFRNIYEFGYALESRVDIFFRQANGEAFERGKRYSLKMPAQ